jgi:hypothetical protein
VARVEISEDCVTIEDNNLPSVLQVMIKRDSELIIEQVTIDKVDEVTVRFENVPTAEVPEIHEENELGPVS